MSENLSSAESTLGAPTAGVEPESTLQSEKAPVPEKELVGTQGKVEAVVNVESKVEPEITEAAEETVDSMKNDEDNALSTLASLAAERDAKGEKLKPQSVWCDVGIIRGTSCVVKDYYVGGASDEHPGLTSDNLIDFGNRVKMCLEPGTAYKFRVAAINSAGRGEWSEVSAFKTCLPGFPGAPSSIKISKSPEGAHLTWEPPPSNSGLIVEYCVCLAVKQSVVEEKQLMPIVPGQLAFAKVYCGKANQATVETNCLEMAHIDTTTKPAIIFRIAAKNDKGYGPATQVRWLQDNTSAPVKTNTRKDKPNTQKKMKQ